MLSWTIDSSYTSSYADSLEVSFWYYAENDRPEYPIWQLIGVLGDNTAYSASLRGIDLIETHKGWLKGTFIIPVSEQLDYILLSSQCPINYYLDNLMVRNTNKNILTKTDGEIFYNNYKVEE